MVRIRLRENGPIVIEADDVTVVDWNGAPYQITKQPVALCRCGGSSRKPFCDGSHKTNGFCGGDAAEATPVTPPPEAPSPR